MSPELEPSGVAWCSVVRRQAVPQGWCQLCAGLSHCRLGYRLDCLKDMSAHSPALLGAAEPNWGYRLGADILKGPGALLSKRCWVMLIVLLAAELQNPDREVIWGLWAGCWMKSIDACRWMMTACSHIRSRKYSLNICFITCTYLISNCLFRNTWTVSPSRVYLEAILLLVSCFINLLDLSI